MVELQDIKLETVKAVYNGPERLLWELIMGEQIHVGGMQSSMALARTAGIAAGSRGVDLCCCTGAGMRFLLKCIGVEHMTGVDAARAVIDVGRERCISAGVSDRVTFRLADACSTGLDDASMDFAWGEDAWCYVEDKDRLIREAIRLVRPGGLIAFTDWIAGPAQLTGDEAQRLLRFMKFPSMLSLSDYKGLLEKHGATVELAEDTGCFARALSLYIQVVAEQLTFDVLRILDYSQDSLEAIANEMSFMHAMANAGKIAQGMFVARKRVA